MKVRATYVCMLNLLLASLCGSDRTFAQDDVADVPSQERLIENDAARRYFLIGAAEGQEAPPDGYGLVVVLPGGDGSAEFHPFVKRIFKNALPPGYLVAQPVAMKFTPSQKIVWPTKKSRAPQMKFSTEEFVDAVIADVEREHRLNPKRIFTLSWSSSGPAAYAVALESTKVQGSFIAMSVFRAAELQPLDRAKDRAFYLYHSPDDRVCPFRMAEQAAQVFEKQGARTKLTTYTGGHGWRGDVFADIQEGIEWLATP